MAGLTGVFSSDIPHLQACASAMLAWCEKGCTLKHFYESSTSAIGCCCSDFHHDTSERLFVAIIGKLIRQNELKEALQLPEIESDAVLLMQAYKAMGVACFKKFYGHFLVIIIDEKTKETHIARDRTGSFDLFWSETPHGLFFSTCLKALLSSGHVPATLDLSGLSSYLALGFISQDKTALQNVNRLLPGYFMTIVNPSEIRILPFWSFSSAFRPKKREIFDTSEEIYLRLEEKIKTAIHRRHDDETSYPAVFGARAGSKIIQEAFVRNTNAPPIPAINIEFEAALNANKDAHPMVLITPDKFLKTVIPLVWSLDTPVADIELIAEWHFCQLCKQHNLTPFFDTGFETEFTHYTLAKKHAMEFPQTPFKTNLYHYFSSLFPKTAFKWLRLSQLKDPRVSYIEKEAQMSKKELEEASPLLAKLFEPDLFLHQFYHLPRINTVASSLFYLSMKTAVVDKMHTARSRVAAAFTLKPEAPFLDIELLEFLASLEEEAWRSPDVLPAFPEVYLGQKVAPKQPIVLDAWLKDRKIIEVLQSLKKGILQESGFVTRNFLEKVEQGELPNSFQKFYSVLVLEVWMRLYLDRPLISVDQEISLEELLH